MEAIPNENRGMERFFHGVADKTLILEIGIWANDGDNWGVVLGRGGYGCATIVVIS